MRFTTAAALAAAGLLIALPASAGMTNCKMTYDLEGWSIFYKNYEGRGTVTCANGESARVAIGLKAGGLTLGKTEINGGNGSFSEVRNLDEVFGTYVALEGAAGATKSAEGRVMTKGAVSLTLSGTGRGWELGATIGGFTIKRL